MYIDSHVHFRDFKQAHKETVKHGLEVARDSGLDAVFDMPNCDPAMTTRDVVVDRLRLADLANVPEVFYGVYMGMTADVRQIREAVRTYREFFPRVVGFKLYAGHSVGRMGVINLEEQARVYQTLSEEAFTGVLAVHAEKEDCLCPKCWNPLQAISHCHARPEKAEIESVLDQIALAKIYNFKGKMHIAHISSPHAVELVLNAKKAGLDISCGVCPHHFIYDWQAMAGQDGILMKMNPPLRSEMSRVLMFEHLKRGNIDWIETDHAPHSLNEKIKEPWMSGIPGLPWWNLYAEYLDKNGIGEQKIRDLTFNNVAQRFGINIIRTAREVKDRRGDYPFNPYKPLELELGL